MADVPTTKELQKLRVVDLKEKLSELGVSTSGLKADLVQRLHETLVQLHEQEEEGIVSGGSETNDSEKEPFKEDSGEDTSPQADDTSPQADDTSPQADDTSPQADDASPQADDTSPMAVDASPLAEDIAAQENENSIAIGESLAPVDETIAQIDETPASVDETLVPMDETPAPLDEIVAPVVEIVAPVEETLALVEETLAPVEEILAPVEEILAPVEEILAPVEETSALIEETLAPVEETLAPVKEILTPVEEVLAPVEETFVPVDNTQHELFEQQKEALALEQVRLLEVEKALQDEELIKLGKQQQQLLEGDVNSEEMSKVERQKNMIAQMDEEMIEKGKQQHLLIEQHEEQERIMIETQKLMLAQQVKEEQIKEEKEKTFLAEQQHQILEHQKRQAAEAFQVLTFGPIASALPASSSVVNVAPVISVPDLNAPPMSNLVPMASTSISPVSLGLANVIVSVPSVISTPEMVQVPSTLLPIPQQITVVEEMVIHPPSDVVLPLHLTSQASIATPEIPPMIQIVSEIPRQIALRQQMEAELQPQIVVPPSSQLSTEMSIQQRSQQLIMTPDRSIQMKHELLSPQINQDLSPQMQQQLSPQISLQVKQQLSPQITQQIITPMPQPLPPISQPLPPIPQQLPPQISQLLQPQLLPQLPQIPQQLPVEMAPEMPLVSPIIVSSSPLVSPLHQQDFIPHSMTSVTSLSAPPMLIPPPPPPMLISPPQHMMPPSNLQMQMEAQQHRFSHRESPLQIHHAMPPRPPIIMQQNLNAHAPLLETPSIVHAPLLETPSSAHAPLLETPPANEALLETPADAPLLETPPISHQIALGAMQFERTPEQIEIEKMFERQQQDDDYSHRPEPNEYHLPSAIEKVLALQNERAQQVGLEEEMKEKEKEAKKAAEIPKQPAAIRSLVAVDEGEDEDDMEDEDGAPQPSVTAAQKLPKESKNKRRKEKKKRARQRRIQQREQDEAKDNDDERNKENDDLDVEIDYIPDTQDQPKDPLYFQFLRIFEKFKLIDPDKPKEELSEEKQKELQRQEEIMNRLAERKKPADIDEKDDDDDDDKKEEEKPKLSKRKLKKLNRMSVAELKQKVGRPELVEMHDVTAKDPVLLLHLKAARNSVPVPRHWCFKRKYLQGKRGIEKPPFDLPEFIKKTGIMEMRQALQEKEEQKTMKAKMRERVRPKMGKIDIDYQKLHDAFFKWQIKPRMTIHGDLYYEGKEFETRLKEKKPGDLSEELRMALGMPTGPNQNKCPPPWLIAMQRYGPPPSYPNLKIPGLNAPIPEGCSFGYHAGGWGKPPVDEMGRPLYGDVFGIQLGDGQLSMLDEEVDRSLWGELESESSEESEEESEEEEEEEKPEDESGLVTPAEGLVTPSGLSSVPAGMETPDMIELRKRKIEAEMEGGETPALYTILPEKNVDKVGGAMMGSTHIYDMTAAMPAAKARGVTGAIAAMMPPQGVEVTLDPSELEMDSVAMAARYEQTVREQQSQLAKEDLSDMVAEHAARQKNKRKKQQQDTSSKTAKKYKEFKF